MFSSNPFRVCDACLSRKMHSMFADKIHWPHQGADSDPEDLLRIIPESTPVAEAGHIRCSSRFLYTTLLRRVNGCSRRIGDRSGEFQGE